MERPSFWRLLNVFSHEPKSREHKPLPHRRDGFTTCEFDQIATVEKRIDRYQRGRVRYQGTYWYAVLTQQAVALPGDRVLVIGQEGITLLVKPIEIMQPDTQSQQSAQSSVSAFPHLRLVPNHPTSDLTSEKGAS